MNTVHKFKVSYGTNRIGMPLGTQLLSADWQYGTGHVVWAAVDTDQPLGLVRIDLVMTGALMPPGQHIGSYTDTNGLVYHAFRVDENLDS